ncbi:MAG TPA: hypothetical protein VNI78_08385 [Vicinamibacterales bacterium]|nr:hypothetical protein [Vicinamibacterales bacterium]
MVKTRTHRRTSKRLTGAALAFAVVAFATAASATVVLPVEFPDMVVQAQTIVHGRVVDVRSHMTAGRRTIETLVTLAVLDALKGEPGRTVVFRVPNGQVGRYRRIMVGAPEFEAGDEVVVFLAGRPPVVPIPFGLSQGVYRVSRAGGRAIVTPLVVGDAGRTVRGDPGRRPLSLDAFAQQVAGVLARRQ